MGAQTARSHSPMRRTTPSSHASGIPPTDSLVIVIAGIQRFGTDAASQFATSSELLQEFNRQVGWNWRNKNVEVVLRVDVVNGRAGAPIIEATHIW